MATTVGTNYPPTDLNAVYDRTMQTGWIATIVLSIVLSCIVFWILISLITYGVKTRKWTRTQNSVSEKLNAGLVYSCVVVCSVLCLSYYIVSLVYVNIGFKKSDELCDDINDLLKIIYSFIIFSSYVFLWLRQRAFYSNKMLNAKFNRLVKVFSVLSIFIIFVGGISALILITYPDNTVSSEEGCVDKRINEDNNLFWFVLCGAAVLVFGQASLLYLLIYALLSSASIPVFGLTMNSKHFRKKKDSVVKKAKPPLSIRPSSNSDDIPRFNRRSIARIQLVIKKTLIFAILSIIADTLTIVIEYTVSKSGQNKRAAVLTAQVSSILTVIFLVLSFVSWKQMLIAPFKYKNISIYLDGNNTAKQNI